MEAKNINLGQGTGRRKTSVARVYLREGNGKITVNGRDVKDYFALDTLVFLVKQPLEAAQALEKYDVLINVCGGGVAGQAGACRHGIARALVNADEQNLELIRPTGFLTRDPRMVERKKYGQRGARRKFQFSKR